MTSQADLQLNQSILKSFFSLRFDSDFDLENANILKLEMAECEAFFFLLSLNLFFLFGRNNLTQAEVHGV